MGELEEARAAALLDLERASRLLGDAINLMREVADSTGRSRELSVAITETQTGELWLGRALADLR